MVPISKNAIKSISLLQQKKYRDEQQLFIVEGDKIIKELHKSEMVIDKIVALEDWYYKNPEILNSTGAEIYVAKNVDLMRMSNFKTPNQVIAVAKYKRSKFEPIDIKNKLTIALDVIQDPGNMGTIIRLADWFGIENIICSNDSVELYNPKVIQSTMGAFIRVNVFHTDLSKFLKTAKNAGISIYGAFLDGENIYKTELKSTGIVVMGNESKGISPEIAEFVSNKLSIPSFSILSSKTESLNVAVATAVICSEFRRRG
jgi:TrmH family RNA methyltransferase